MHTWEKYIYIVLLVAFLLFNCCFWIGQWSISENDSQGLLEWCFHADGNRCCKSVSELDIDTQDWFHHFKKSISGAWVFVALTFIVSPYCGVLAWTERKLYVLVLMFVACFSSAACLMVAVCEYGLNFKSSLKHHNLHASFGIAVVCLLLYTFAGIATIVYIIKEQQVLETCRGPSGPAVPSGKSGPAVPSGASGPAVLSVPSGPFRPQAKPGVTVRSALTCRDCWNDRYRNYFEEGQPAPSELCMLEMIGLAGSRSKGQTRFKGRWTGVQTRGNLQIVQLPENSNEYTIVKQSFQTNNGNFKIVEICRVQNKRLYEAHLSFEKHFMDIAKRQYPCSYRKYLWHGTSEDSSKNINQYGFNRNYQGKNACYYGDGVYFARDPSYSSDHKYSVPDSNGDKLVYKCSVFVGRYGEGKQNMKEPPTDVNGVRYDSAVDNLKDPKIHVIFRDYQAYPEYLIKFNGA